MLAGGATKCISSDECIVAETACAICHETFTTGDSINKLPCCHVYHHNCLSQWIERSCTCPTCRFELTDEAMLGTMVKSSTTTVDNVENVDSGDGHNLSITQLGEEWYCDEGESTSEQVLMAPGGEVATSGSQEGGGLMLEVARPARQRNVGRVSRLGRWRPRRLLQRIHIHI
jgi:hypothetical protein